MVGISFGLQLFSVKNALKQDYFGTLRKVADIGYRHLEYVIRETDAGLDIGGDATLREVRSALDEFGLNVVSSHTRVGERTDWSRLLDANHALGCSAIVTPVAFFTDKDSIFRFCEKFNAYGERCKRESFQLYYHNHFHEFQRIDGELVFDLLLSELDPSFVRFEFDTYWAVRGGADPVDWLHKLGSRCGLLHQKDLPATAVPVNWFDAFGREEPIDIGHLYKTQHADQFAEVGEGVMDIAAIVEAACGVGAECMFVELDVASRDELESAAIGFAGMKTVLERAAAGKAKSGDARDGR